MIYFYYSDDDDDDSIFTESETSEYVINISSDDSGGESSSDEELILLEPAQKKKVGASCCLKTFAFNRMDNFRKFQGVIVKSIRNPRGIIPRKNIYPQKRDGYNFVFWTQLWKITMKSRSRGHHCCKTYCTFFIKMSFVIMFLF